MRLILLLGCLLIAETGSRPGLALADLHIADRNAPASVSHGSKREGKTSIFAEESRTKKIPRPLGSAYWEKRGQGRVFYGLRLRKKRIAITFDDGPDPRFTPVILHILKAHHAKATFFIIGSSARRFPGMVSQISGDGHEIGNHTDTHPPADQITDREVSKCDFTLWALTGLRPTLFRPPRGTLDDRLLEIAARTNHIIAMWSWDTDTRDWSRPGYRTIVNHAVQNAHPGDIVLFHDGGGHRKQTVRALPIVLERLSKEGYRFVTVSELLRMR